MTEFPRLRSLGALHRLALTLLCLVLAGGFAASASHLFIKTSGRDQVKGMSLDDVKGTYHGIRTRAPLLMALERNHPETLPAKDRDVLIKWLNGSRITEDYDNPDLGDAAPAEIIARHCVSCHGRNASDAQGRKLPLEFLDDVRAVAVSRDVTPNPVEAVVASTHAHAVSLATLSMLLILLVACSRWRGGLAGLIVTVHALGLACDIGGWWLTRQHADLAAMIVAGGAAYFATSGLLLLMVLAELWLPARDK
ncbi:MAG: hypothetical protein WCK33_02780 [Phycisphaerae bacterium]